MDRVIKFNCVRIFFKGNFDASYFIVSVNFGLKIFDWIIFFSTTLFIDLHLQSSCNMVLEKSANVCVCVCVCACVRACVRACVCVCVWRRAGSELFWQSRSWICLHSEQCCWENGNQTMWSDKLMFTAWFNGVLFEWHGNAKAYSTCIAPQAEYCSCNGAFCVTDRAGIQAYRPQSKLPRTLTCNQTDIAVLVCRLMVSIPVMHGLLLIYWSRRDGRLSWPGWLTHSDSRQFAYKAATCQSWVRHRSGKVCQPKSDTLSTEPCHQYTIVTLKFVSCMFARHTWDWVSLSKEYVIVH